MVTSLWLKATVLLWWLLNLAQSFHNSGRFTEPPRTANWEIARKYLRFVELTTFQLLVGGVATAFWLKVVHKKPLFPKDLNLKTIALVTFLNLVGNLAVNFTLSTRTARTRDALRGLEPAVVFALLTIVGYHKANIRSFSIPSGLAILAVGSWSVLIRGDVGFNRCGVVGGVVSIVAFSLRNIVLKSFGETWPSALQKYCVISLYGSLALSQVSLAKLLFTRILPLVPPRDLLASAAFQFADGLTSISVLESTCPFFHAVLGATIHVSITTATVVYVHARLTWFTLVGSAAFVAGLFYCSKGVTQPRGRYDELKRTVGYFLIALFLVLSFLKVTRMATSRAELTPTFPSETVGTFWPYDEPPSRAVLRNVKRMRVEMGAARVHVFCATSRCVEKIRGIGDANIAASFLNFPDIVRGSPLEPWFSRHALHKVLAGKHFEEHVHEAVRLALLWRRGGVYLDPFRRIHKVEEFAHTSPWVSLSSVGETGGVLWACNFSRGHPFVTMLARAFVDRYSDATDSRGKLRNFVLDFHNTASRTLLSFCGDSPNLCPETIRIKSSVVKDEMERRQFVVVSGKSSAGLSLAIDILAAVQFLPYVDSVLDNYPREANIEPGATALVTSVQMANPMWPLLRNATSVILSARLDSRNRPSPEHIEFLRRRAPIGCSDSQTVSFLRKNGVTAYYSGGIPLVAKIQYSSQVRSNAVYFVDVHEEVKQRFRSTVRRYAQSVDRAWLENHGQDQRTWFKKAHDLIERYSTAALIITQNVRHALIAASINTPVLYINSTGVPSGRSDLADLQQAPKVFRVTEPDRLFEYDALKSIANLSATDELCPNPGLLMRLRATAWSAIRGHDSLREAALRFGVVPFRRPLAASSNIMTFHLVFTTSRRSSIVLGGGGGGGGGGDDSRRETVTGAFVWRHWRCVESIFHHHPFAKVVIHSNTLSQSTFDVLTEAGYDIQVRPYDLAELAKGTSAEVFVRDEFPYAREGEHWYSHETDLLRLLILLKWGGVYMDTDVVVVRPLYDLPPNVLGWESSYNVNGAFLKFAKSHPFLEACVSRFSRHYSQAWSENGPLLLSRVWREWSAGHAGSDDVRVLHKEAFYMFSYGAIKSRCFEETSGARYETNLYVLRTEAYVVHLYSKVTAAYGTEGRKIKEGTLCKHILNSFCVLCQHIY